MEMICNSCGWEFYEPVVLNGVKCCPECETGGIEGEVPDIEYRLMGKKTITEQQQVKEEGRW